MPIAIGIVHSDHNRQGRRLHLYLALSVQSCTARGWNIGTRFCAVQGAHVLYNYVVIGKFSIF